MLEFSKYYYYISLLTFKFHTEINTNIYEFRILTLGTNKIFYSCLCKYRIISVVIVFKRNNTRRHQMWLELVSHTCSTHFLNFISFFVHLEKVEIRRKFEFLKIFIHFFKAFMPLEPIRFQLYRCKYENP